MRRRHWNRVDEQVYSLYTDKKSPNMNICTYVTPISLQPKAILIGIYKGTYTYDNIGTRVLLQYLTKKQASLIRRLGYKNGPNKINTLELLDYKGLMYLKDCFAVVELEVIERKKSLDHDILICKVLSHKNLNEEKPLTTSYLREKKIIS